jgi:hypothetical protein
LTIEARCGDGLAQACDLLFGGAFGRHAGGAGFQEDARFLHMPEHVRLGAQEMLRTSRDLGDQAVGRGVDHTRRSPWAISTKPERSMACSASRTPGGPRRTGP